jgi:hypothetical protein
MLVDYMELRVEQSILAAGGHQTHCPAAGKSSHCSTRCRKTDVPCFFPFLQIYDPVKFITQVDAQGLYIVIIHKGREFHFYRVIHVKFY